MQKSLLTMALALALPTAYAQSSVTLYGIVDVGIENLDVGSVDATRLQSGISAGSRWGIRGSEDLGGGYRAVFTLESRIEVDTGSVTNNGALYWCKASSAAAAVPAVCPGVVFVTTPAGHASATGRAADGRRWLERGQQFAVAGDHHRECGRGAIRPASVGWTGHSVRRLSCSAASTRPPTRS